MAYNSGMSKFSKKLLISFLIPLFAVSVFAEPGGTSPGGGMGIPDGGPGQMPPPPPPLPPKDPENTFKYRGTRAYAENQPLEIKLVKCIKTENNEVILEVSFNQSINPKSIKNQNVYINDERLLEDIKIVFNKKGDTIKIQIPMVGEAFKLRLSKVRSFNGSMMGTMETWVKVQKMREEV